MEEEPPNDALDWDEISAEKEEEEVGHDDYYYDDGNHQDRDATPPRQPWDIEFDHEEEKEVCCGRSSYVFLKKVSNVLAPLTILSAWAYIL